MKSQDAKKPYHSNQSGATRSRKFISIGNC